MNTVGGPRDAGPDPDDDALTSYEALVAWSERIGTISPRQASVLRSAAKADPAAAEAALADALSVRALVYEAFRAFADGRKP